MSTKEEKPQYKIIQLLTIWLKGSDMYLFFFTGKISSIVTIKLLNSTVLPDILKWSGKNSNLNLSLYIIK